MPSPKHIGRAYPPRTGCGAGGRRGRELSLPSVCAILAWSRKRGPDVALATGAGRSAPRLFRSGGRPRRTRRWCGRGLACSGRARLADGAIKAAGRFLEPPNLIVAALGSGRADGSRPAGWRWMMRFVLVDPASALVLAITHIHAAGDRARPCRPAARPFGGHAVRRAGCWQPILAPRLWRASPPRPISKSPAREQPLSDDTGDGQAIAS